MGGIRAGEGGIRAGEMVGDGGIRAADRYGIRAGRIIVRSRWLTVSEKRRKTSALPIQLTNFEIIEYYSEG